MQTTTEATYYTPSIEEFHVGFSYEFRHPDYKEAGWIKYDTPQLSPEKEDCPFAYIDGDMSDFRVKRLDREDIEAEGWEYSHIISSSDKPNAFYETVYRKEEGVQNFTLTHSSEWHVHVSRWRMDNPKQPTTSSIFCGTIRNRSELKTIMRQIGVK